jgi:hypothetical protein
VFQVVAKEGKVSVIDHLKGTRERTDEIDPITVAGTISERWVPCRTEGLPDCFTGGWVGYMVGLYTLLNTMKQVLPRADSARAPCQVSTVTP